MNLLFAALRNAIEAARGLLGEPPGACRPEVVRATSMTAAHRHRAESPFVLPHCCPTQAISRSEQVHRVLSPRTSHPRNFCGSTRHALLSGRGGNCFQNRCLRPLGHSSRCFQSASSEGNVLDRAWCVNLALSARTSGRLSTSKTDRSSPPKREVDLHFDEGLEASALVFPMDGDLDPRAFRKATHRNRSGFHIDVPEPSHPATRVNGRFFRRS